MLAAHRWQGCRKCWCWWQCLYVRVGGGGKGGKDGQDSRAGCVFCFRVGYAVAGNNFQTWFCGSAIGGESESSTCLLSAGRGRRQSAAAPCTESESAGRHSRKERLGVYSGMVVNGCEAGFQWKLKILSAIKSWKNFYRVAAFSINTALLLNSHNHHFRDAEPTLPIGSRLSEDIKTECFPETEATSPGSTLVRTPGGFFR